MHKIILFLAILGTLSSYLAIKIFLPQRLSEFEQQLLSSNSESFAFQPHSLVSSARNEVFPELEEGKGGVINIKNYGAVGDGITDDTEAFRLAMTRDEIANGNKIIYVPKGTYLVSNTIEWPQGAHGGLYYKRTTLMGESQTESMIKLQDHAPGFSNGESKPVIDTRHNRANGFRNRIENLTVNTGSGNSNAIGIKINSNNGGGVFDVSIVSGDGQGSRGLDLTAVEIGPILIKNITITGFDRGILVGGGPTNSVHMENVTVRDQKQFGIEQAMQVVTIRNLKSVNRVPAIFVEGHRATLALIHAELAGVDGKSTTAIETQYRESGIGTPGEKRTIQTFLSDVKQTGYRDTAKVYNCETGQLETLQGNIEEWTCSQPLTGFSAATKMMNLPIEETPYIQHNLDAISIVQGSSGADIQVAIDTPNAKTVFLPNRVYTVDKTIQIRGSISKIIGMGARFSNNSTIPTFRFEDGDEPIVSLERLERASIEHNSKRQLVIKHSALESYSNTNAGMGDVFLEDIVSGLIRIHQQKVWARGLNVEAIPSESEAKILNDGGVLWILGLKTEKPGTILETKNQGVTEVLGGFIYINSDIPDVTPPQPQYINENSQVAILTRSYLPTARGYEVLVREIQNSAVNDLINKNRRSGTRLFPYLGYSSNPK
ncbi:MAG: glycoside hydrolase family 55 protein [Microcoleaceae cyanobacterium]